MASKKHFVVITRNGETRVVSGWQAWLYGVGGLLLAWIILGAFVFALAGLAATVGVALMLLIPAVVIVAVVSTLLRKAGW